MNIQESIRRILREEDFIPLEDLNTVIKDYEDGFDVFIMNGDKKIGEISFAKEDKPDQYTIVDATIDDEYKGNRIYPKTIINLFKERPNLIINSVFRSPDAEKAWIYLLSDLPSNIEHKVKYYEDEETTLYQLKLKNLQESIRRIVKEVRVPRNERVELYKDNNIIVVVPLTHRALKKYANQCQWCINSDLDEWEDYHKGKHAVIIQRNPKKPKMGITGHPTASEIFFLAKWDNGESDFDDICQILDYEFRNDRTMADYYTTISNDINNFGTNIVYYSPENGVYDQEDNFLWNFNYEISDIPNVTPEVIKIMDNYLQEEEEMNLQESIRRILKEEFNQLPKYLYHLTSDENYKNILMEGFLNPKYSKQSKRKKGIYLSDDISVAENYRFFYEPDEKVVLLKIKTSSLNEDSFYPDDYELQDFLNDGGWGVSEDIEYSRWYDVPWQLSLKWVNQIQYLEPIPISEIKKI